MRSSGMGMAVDMNVWRKRRFSAQIRQHQRHKRYGGVRNQSNYAAGECGKQVEISYRRRACGVAVRKSKKWRRETLCGDMVKIIVANGEWHQARGGIV